MYTWHGDTIGIPSISHTSTLPSSLCRTPALPYPPTHPLTRLRTHLPSFSLYLCVPVLPYILTGQPLDVLSQAAAAKQQQQRQWSGGSSSSSSAHHTPLLLDWVNGCRSPHNNAELQGGFTGLSMETGEVIHFLKRNPNK